VSLAISQCLYILWQVRVIDNMYNRVSVIQTVVLISVLTMKPQFAQFSDTETLGAELVFTLVFL